jgi:dTDP-L-rhamnose 4-epimerase
MPKNILITGGAGFIGSHLADDLLRRGHQVRAYDVLCPQVHGPDAQRPAYLDAEIELVVGDVRDRSRLRRALEGIDVVYHFAAKVGVGQSMYQVADYTEVNNQGTAVLMEELIRHPVERLIIASSMSIYGEGLYHDSLGRSLPGKARPIGQLKAHRWEMQDEQNQALVPIPTPEWKQPSLASIYALSKYDQERMCLLLGRAYGIPTVALRFFNVYGTRQALSNPYTGVLAIFASRLLNDSPPLLFEDGLQQRDFVNVSDIAQACRLALEKDEASYEVFNIGSGKHFTVGEIARRLAKIMGKKAIEPKITGKYRVGDIRHCFADISKAQEQLGYRPAVTLEAGLEELVDWLEGQIVIDRVAEAGEELMERGLTV